MFPRTPSTHERRQEGARTPAAPKRRGAPEAGGPPAAAPAPDPAIDPDPVQEGAVTPAEGGAWAHARGVSATEVAAGHDLSGHTHVVTGANTGIGFEIARALAGTGARVVLACRQTATGEAAAARIRAGQPQADLAVLPLDLASFRSVLSFADALDAPRIHALVCNAGLAPSRYETTEEGFEKTVGVCHIGHFLLTRLLAGRLLATPGPRVVMVSSESHRMPPRLDFARLPLGPKGYRGLVAYGQAKLCNVLMARALDRRYGPRGLVGCAVHPGTLVRTEIGRNSRFLATLVTVARPFTKTAGQAAATPVLGVVHEPADPLHGAYLVNCRPARSSAEADDPSVAERLWDLSEAWVAEAGAPAWPEA